MEQMCKKELFDLIQQTKFAMVDMALYLDTHPHCQRALETYHHYHKINDEAMAIYEHKFGPLSIFGMHDENKWTWGEEPWPWQKECDC